MPRAHLIIATLAPLGLSGCIAYTIADTAVSVTATAVETSADIVGGAVDLALPDDEEEDGGD